MAKKTKVTISVIFEDGKDLSAHLTLIKARVNAFLKNPGEEELKTGEESTSWSSHTYSIETIEQ